MEYQNDEDDLGKDHQDAICLSSKRHVEEDAEDIKWQERNDELGDDARYDVLEFSEDIVHCAARFVGNTNASDKGEYKCTHHIHHGWYFQFEERFEFLYFIYGYMSCASYHVRKA